LFATGKILEDADILILRKILFLPVPVVHGGWYKNTEPGMYN
jgi:hypothetical protein